MQMARGTREFIKCLRPAPQVVLSSPLTRALQTALIAFKGIDIAIEAVDGAREAHGQFPCDRRRPKLDLRDTFGTDVDLEQVTDWVSFQQETLLAASFIEY
jgi:phosphohistidine phosphatase SixA